MAAGDGTGNGDGSGENIVSGVAPDADLILSSIPNTEGSYSSDDFAADLDSARGYSAVASNNSWAIGDDTVFTKMLESFERLNCNCIPQ